MPELESGTFVLETKMIANFTTPVFRVQSGIRTHDFITRFADVLFKPLRHLDIFLVTQVGLEPTTALRSLRIKSAKLYQLSYCVILSSRMDSNHRPSSYQDVTLYQLSYETNCRVDRT